MDADQETGDAQRWARADAILAGQPPLDARLGPWRRRIRAGAVALGLAVLAFGLAVLLVRVLADGAHEPGRWENIAAGVVFGYGVVLFVVAIGLLEPPRYRGRVRMWGSPLGALSARQRRGLLDQVVGRRPVDVVHVALARDLAMRRIEQARRQVPLMLSTLLLAGPIISDDALLPWLWLVVAALFCAGGVLFRLDMRRYRRFLRDNPGPEE